MHHLTVFLLNVKGILCAKSRLIISTSAEVHKCWNTLRFRGHAATISNCFNASFPLVNICASDISSILNVILFNWRIFVSFVERNDVNCRRFLASLICAASRWIWGSGLYYMWSEKKWVKVKYEVRSA